MGIEEYASNDKNSEGSEYQESTESLDFSTDEYQTITSPLQDVKNVKKFPFIAIGTLLVKFPQLKKNINIDAFL